MASKATITNENYKKKMYDRILLQFPIGSKERLRSAAISAGYSSVNGWIAAILERECGERLTLRKPYKSAEDAADGDEK